MVCITLVSQYVSLSVCVYNLVVYLYPIANSSAFTEPRHSALSPATPHGASSDEAGELNFNDDGGRGGAREPHGLIYWQMWCFFLKLDYFCVTNAGDGESFRKCQLLCLLFCISLLCFSLPDEYMFYFLSCNLV
jgi:hypothetical protein